MSWSFYLFIINVDLWFDLILYLFVWQIEVRRYTLVCECTSTSMTCVLWIVSLPCLNFIQDIFGTIVKKGNFLDSKVDKPIYSGVFGILFIFLFFINPWCSRFYYNCTLLVSMYLKGMKIYQIESIWKNRHFSRKYLFPKNHRKCAKRAHVVLSSSSFYC